ncbi:MAG: isoprenylcysteine carboxylmethyltransferase family protein [Gemmatimonadota bacterium]|jgi:protein-S-isoprenylcysteine O-methyltransferase Ste14
MAPAAWFVGALVLTIALHALVPGARWLARPWTLAGVVLAGAGVVVHVAATNVFRRYRTTTAALAPPASLVTDGPYRYSRNPMYLGGVLMLLGMDMLLGSATPLLVVPLWIVIMQARYIRREEALLRREFGAAYDAYCSGVRRWL